MICEAFQGIGSFRNQEEKVKTSRRKESKKSWDLLT